MGLAHNEHDANELLAATSHIRQRVIHLVAQRHPARRAQRRQDVRIIGAALAITVIVWATLATLYLR